MNKRVAIMLTVAAAVLVLFAAGLYFGWLHRGEPSSGSHGGTSVAVWIAIFSGVWVPLLAGSARRRRQKKDQQDRQP